MNFVVFSETADYYNKKLGSDGRVLVASSLKKARLFQDFPGSRTGLVRPIAAEDWSSMRRLMGDGDQHS